MIITVTMNPAIDKTVDVDLLEIEGLNRIKRVELDAGGKGINVSKTICELGGVSLATGFLGGSTGKIIENVLNEKKIKNDFIWVDGETRTNTKVFEENGGVTELNEPGPVISEEQLEELLKKLESYASEDTIVVLAGSIPSGVPKDIYARIIKMVKAKGASVLLDADGDMFRLALEAGPDIIKPNRVELEEYAGMDYRASQEELQSIARKLHDKGIKTVAVSMGQSGAMILKDGYEVKCPALKVKTHSTVGAGDAMVAALAYAWDEKLDDEETVKLCIATSAGAVTTIGTKPPSMEVVEELKRQVIIEKIGE
ncbi:MAG: 1-phosphofructokinase [Lachnospiraceae bacterium]|nr:1-phosphofructokinase [Lachnospiraceae bacterium]MDD3617494.1 1-phosphofructokinase [Lachnospiraceae bacterium]